MILAHCFDWNFPFLPLCWLEIHSLCSCYSSTIEQNWRKSERRRAGSSSGQRDRTVGRTWRGRGGPSSCRCVRWVASTNNTLHIPELLFSHIDMGGLLLSFQMRLPNSFYGENIQGVLWGESGWVPVGWIIVIHSKECFAVLWCNWMLRDFLHNAQMDLSVQYPTCSKDYSEGYLAS